MGRGYIEYDLPESARREWVLFSAFIDYRLADGSKLHIPQQAAWCPACNRFVVAEELPSVEALADELERFHSGERETIDRWTFCTNGLPVAGRIADLLRYIEWRKGRKSPPRCLECGSLNPVPILGRRFAHPQTGEPVVEVGNGFAVTESWIEDFSSEGEKLGDDLVTG